MTTPSQDGESGPSADERDVGWGGRDWERDDPEGAGGDAADLERLRAERPPHHEERER
jgi:hypothetical protein